MMKVASSLHAALYLVTRVSAAKAPVSAEVRFSCSSLVATLPAPGLSSEDRK